MLPLVIILILPIVSVFGGKYHIVETENGKVNGTKEVNVNLKEYYRFLGIPYAEPPTGQNRFKSPIAKRNWTGILQATSYGSECLQGGVMGNPDTISGSEECLYLNVFTPQLADKDKKPLPVMVWIHGGAFFMGSGNMDDTKPDFLLDYDVVVVSINYRLGLLGFMTTGDSACPGNNGLKDQVTALRWVKHNIGRFGGNPDKVTIFGQSAGSASVSYLMQSPLAKDLFHQGIMESGTSLCSWAISKKASGITNELATYFKLEYSNTNELVDGLRALNISDLQVAYRTIIVKSYLYINPIDGFLVAPVIEPDVEGALITFKSYDLLLRGDFEPKPVIIGHNTLELNFNLPDILKTYLLKYDLFPNNLVPDNMNVKSNRKNALGEKIKEYYFNGTSMSLSNTSSLLNFFNDDVFNRPIQKFAELWAKKAQTFTYVFGYQGSLWGVTNRTIPGVGHTEELGYLFLSKFKGPLEDHWIRGKMVKMWTNFAKCGNPNDNSILLRDVNWIPNNPRNRDFGVMYLNVNDTVKMHTNYKYENMRKWDEWYTNYGLAPFDSY